MAEVENYNYKKATRLLPSWTKEQFNKEIDGYIEEIDELQVLHCSNDKFPLWREKVCKFLARCLGEKARQCKEFEEIVFPKSFGRWWKVLLVGVVGVFVGGVVGVVGGVVGVGGVVVGGVGVVVIGRVSMVISGYRLDCIYRSILSHAKHFLIIIQYEVDTFFPDEAANNTKVFIVHGRDHGTREMVASALKQLGLEPIILAEQANGGKTIIEKLEEHSDVGFAVVLLTPDDEGRLVGTEEGEKERELQKRTRQNVVSEWGYFMAKLGRSNVCYLYQKGVEPIGDTMGMVYIELDAGGAWKQKLVNKLQAAGYPVSADKLLKR